VAAAVAAALTALAAARLSWWIAPAAGVPLALWLGVLWFFRDPDRAIPQAEGLLVSPADGRVADITRVGADSPLGRDGVKIGIFMSVFDVHVNRSPAAARVVRFKHSEGAFLDARDPQAGLRNRSTTIHLAHRRRGTDHPLVVRQIAGLIARRVVTDLSEGQELARGQRIGMIKFGSRVELFVPKELAGRVRAQVGRRVRAGDTVLIAAGEERGDEQDSP